MRCLILGVVLAATASGALAQEAGGPVAPAAAIAPTPSPSPSVTQAAPAPIAPAGSPVIIEIVEALSSRSIKQGEMFAIRLAAPLVVDGRVVIPAGAMGQGQVVDAGRAGALGKPAKLVLAARYIKLDGVRVDLRGFRLGAAGRDNSNAIMAASFVPYVGMLALFAKGGEIDVPAGTLGQAKLAADLPGPTPAASTPPVAPAAAPTP